MCGTCGCAEGEPALGGSPVSVLRAEPRRVAVERSLLGRNDALARELEERFRQSGIAAIGLLGGPGAGKTSLLEATLRRLGAGAHREGVLEGDCAGDRDAQRLARCGARALQIQTGGLCHLDAALVRDALDALDASDLSRLWIENVGNLVCPAPFRCGERWRVGLLSVPEGDDKPEKYPALFGAIDLLVVSKIDLLPHVDFDLERCAASARALRPELPVIALSARTGEGMDAWLAWVAERSA